LIKKTTPLQSKTKNMYRLISTLFLVALSVTAFSQSRAIYVNPKFYHLAKKHEKVAVIPFSVQIGLRPKERESISDEKLKEMEQNEGIAAQNALVSWFLKKQKSKAFPIEFQDVQATNAKLKKAGIDLSNLTDYTPQELAGILGVDAVMGGFIQTTKPMSEGASIALGVAFGVWGNTNSGNITINLSNAADGALLWKYDKELARSLGSDMNVLMDTLMRKASKKFPYLDMEKYKNDAKK
jgi:hypothetical protein